MVTNNYESQTRPAPAGTKFINSVEIHMKNYLYIAFALAVISGCASTSAPSNFSGFNSQQYYEKLTEVPTPNDQALYRYIAPDFNPSDYHHFIVVPVTAYPKPKPTEQVSIEALENMQISLTLLVEETLAEILPLTQAPGPGVIRFEVVVTGVNISDKDLEPWEFIPTQLIAAGVSTAVGERDQSVKLFLESKVTDSASGEVLAATVSELSGEDLENVKSNLQAQNLGKSFTAASGLMSTTLKEIFSR